MAKLLRSMVVLRKEEEEEKEEEDEEEEEGEWTKSSLPGRSAALELASRRSKKAA